MGHDDLAAGATFGDVVKANYCLLAATQVQVIRDLRARYFTTELPASTLVQVCTLARPDFLLEIAAITIVAE